MNSILRFSSLFFILFGAITLSKEANAQGCDNLFISEYIEGWGNNKAIEVYNPTSAAIDLSDYRLERYSNGSPSAAENQKVQLSGVLQPNDVMVFVLDKQDPDGVDFEQPVWDELAEAADVWLCPVYDVNNAMYFNGNDAMVLARISDGANLDILGIIGQDPGETGWEGMTQNHTLVRKSSVTTGNSNPFAFDVAGEWNATPWQNDSLTSTLDSVFLNLGSHSCDCSSTGIAEKNIQTVTMYPNPSNGGAILLQSQGGISGVELINMAGQVVRVENNLGATGVLTINVGDLSKGVYMVRVTNARGEVSTQRLIVQD